MAPTKNLRKNYSVKSKKRPIPKNNKRKTNKSKKRTSRNKRRTRRKQNGGMRTRVIVSNEKQRGRFPTLSRKKKKIEPELPPVQQPVAQSSPASQAPVAEERVIVMTNELSKHSAFRHPIHGVQMLINTRPNGLPIQYNKFINAGLGAPSRLPRQ
jgi:hypothetical protein